MLAFYLSETDTEEDSDFFEKIYKENIKKTYNYAYHILKDHQLSEDAVQEAFLIFANNMEKVSDKSHKQILNYLYIIVRNVCFQMYGKRKKRLCMNEAEALVDDEDISKLDIDVENKIMQERIVDIIKGLDTKYGDVLILKYYYDKKDKEIARMLGISLENVKIRLLRGKQKIKKKIIEEDLYDR